MSKTPRVALPGLTQTPAAPLTNKEVLEGNRAATLGFAQTVIGAPPAPLTDEALEARKKAVAEAVAAGEWSKAIIGLDELKDNKIGIVWAESDNLGVNGTRAIVRDARKVTTDVEALKREQGEKYAMQILNEVRGSLALIEHSAAKDEQKQAARARLQYIAETAIGDVDKLNKDTVRTYNTQILHSLGEIDLDEETAAQRLVFAKETGNLQDEHRHIVTLTKAQDQEATLHTVIEADVMLNGLTNKQKQELEAIQKSKGRPSRVEWFDKMEPYKRDIVRDMVPEILSGKKVLPTQLLSDIPGMKNAYEKTTAIKEDGQDTKVKLLTQTLHSGNPGTRIKIFKEQETGDLSKAVERLKKVSPTPASPAAAPATDSPEVAITKGNLEQLKSFTSRNLQLNLLTSSSPDIAYKIVHEDKLENDLIEQIEQAADGLGVSTTTSPINIARLVGTPRDSESYKEILTTIASELGEATVLNANGALGYLKGEGKKTDAQEFIATLKESKPELSRMLETMVRCRELADTEMIWSSGSGNLNAELTAKMNVVLGAAKLENGVLRDYLEDVQDQLPDTVDFCKSGKDRTGLVMAMSSYEAVATHLGVEPGSDLERQNLLSLYAGNHAQEMSGVQGGTIGCHTLKFGDKTQLDDRSKEFEGILSQKSSDFNSKIKTIEESRFSRGTPKQKKAIAEFEERFAEHQENQALAPAQALTPSPAPAQTTSSRRQTPSGAAQAPADHAAGAPTAQSSEPLLSGSLEEKQQIFESVLMNFEAITKSAQTAAELQAAITKFKAYVEEFRQAVEASKGQQQGQSMQQPTQAQAPETKAPGDKSAVFAEAAKVGKDIKGAVVPHQPKGQEDAPTSDILKKIKQDKLLQKPNGQSNPAAMKAGHKASEGQSKS